MGHHVMYFMGQFKLTYSVIVINVNALKKHTKFYCFSAREIQYKTVLSMQ